MRAALQRVRHASVRVEGETVGRTGEGLLVLVGVRKGDSPGDCEWIAGKIAGLRIFPDGSGRMSRSVAEAGGGVLLVPQFTLYGDVRKGRRPSFDRAAPPEEAVPLLDSLKERLEGAGLRVETGRFGAHMQVDLCNDGPVTILLDSEDRSRGGGWTTVGDRASARQRLLDGGSAPGGVPLVLASASPRRRVLLGELGLEFSVEPVDIDESADLPERPEDQARVLAERKARIGAAGRSEGLVIAADTVVVLDGRVYGKPVSGNEAARMLTELSGREHTVLTGVAVADAATGGVRSSVTATRVRFHTLGKDEVRRYVATGEPMDKAGAYAIQGRGSLLVAGIRGDYTNVVGLPLGPTVDLLHAALRKSGAAREEAT